LLKKLETAKQFVPGPVIDRPRGAKIGFIAYGTTDLPHEESRHQLRTEAGVETSYCRLRAQQFKQQLEDFVAAHDRVYVVEQNRDGQMGDLIRLEVANDQGKIRKILHYTGLPCDARFITESVLEMESNHALLKIAYEPGTGSGSTGIRKAED